MLQAGTWGVPNASALPRASLHPRRNGTGAGARCWGFRGAFWGCKSRETTRLYVLGSRLQKGSFYPQIMNFASCFKNETPVEAEKGSNSAAIIPPELARNRTRGPCSLPGLQGTPLRMDVSFILHW